jgi:alanine racemase
MTLIGRYATWVEVDLKAIERNIRYFVERSEANVMAVVKADGYGHGAVRCARAALAGGATWLAVARPEEALELREAGLDGPILVLGFTPPEAVPEMVSARVSMPVWDRAGIQMMAQAATQAGGAARLHLKVDTGMSRLGVQTEDALALARELGETDHVIFEGIFSHYSRADEQDPSPTRDQRRSFLALLGALEAHSLRPPLAHIANSAASLTGQEHHFDMLRVGIAIYGLNPSSECRLPAPFRPALTWKTQLAQVKTLPPGRGISYGHVYTTQSEERIGTLPVGYADGFRRWEGNQVLVRGLQVPVVGRVCMDQCMVSLERAPGASEGDEVVIIGAQGDARITAEQVARRWHTINYEVVCGIGPRVPRIYPG